MTETNPCPVCDATGSYMLRIGKMTRVKCMRCQGSGISGTYSAEQNAAITEDNPFVLVSAAAGSGKTRVVQGRALWLLERGIMPHQKCFVTFTVAGAKVMRERLGAANPAYGPNACHAGYVGTLHGMCLKILRGLDPLISVLYPEDADEILIATAKAFKDKTPIKRLRELRAAWWIESGKLEVRRMTAEQRTVHAYYARLLSDHMLDYDGILWRGLAAIRLFGLPWKALFVDEFQDSGAIDMAIYDASQCQYRMFVGDSDQSIYAFRGGCVENIIAIAKHPEWSHRQLTTNYRSGFKIVEASQRLIRHNQTRIDLESRAGRTESGTVGLLEFSDPHTQNQDIAARVQQQIADGIPAQNIAILASQHSVTRDVADALRAVKIPVRMQTQSSLPVDWKITRLLIALLAQPANWGIGEIVLRKCRAQDEFQIRAAKQAGTPAAYFGIPAKLTVEQALNELGRLGAGTDSILAVRKWIDRAQPQTLADLQLGIIASDETEITGEGVYVGTVHSAKGREWPVVILAALEETVLPFGDLANVRHVEEQRRLAYVAVTRAVDELWLYSSRWREFSYGTNFSEKKDTGPSRFIAEMKP